MDQTLPVATMPYATSHDLIRFAHDPLHQFGNRRDIVDQTCDHATTPADAPKLPSMREVLSRLHFDLAGTPVPEQLTLLLSMADPSHLHYGSDWPFTPPQVCKTQAL